MQSRQSLALTLTVDDWAGILGALWLLARTHPELTDRVGPLAQQLYHAYAASLGLDPCVAHPLLNALPWERIGDDSACLRTDRG